MIVDTFLILLITMIVIMGAIIAKMVSFFKDFAEDNRYICYRMDCADSYEEYRRWRGELRCHYLMLLPFINRKNVMQLYRLIFRKSKDNEQEERKDSLMMLVLPSMLGICLCLVCVCSMTWAWYSAGIQTSTQKMTAAYYNVEVVALVDKDNKDKKDSLLTDGRYNLEAEETYTITLKAVGSVKTCAGYCLIEHEGGKATYYTRTFEPDKTIMIQLTPKEGEGGTYSFTGVWGSIPTKDGIEPLPDYVPKNEPNQTVAPETEVPVQKEPVQKEPVEETMPEESKDTPVENPATEPKEETPIATDTMQKDTKDDVATNKEE